MARSAGMQLAASATVVSEKCNCFFEPITADKPNQNPRSIGIEHDVMTIESSAIRPYLIGEKSTGRMYVESTFSTSLLACSEFSTSWNPGSVLNASQCFFASSRLG